jgi:glycosyltransferase involved in cell wall biosynthesis
MKLLFLEYQPRFVGGSERMALALCRYMQIRGHQSWLVYGEPGDMVAAYAAAGAQCRKLPVAPLAVRHPWKAARSIKALRGIVQRERIDAIFTSQVSYVSLLAAMRCTTAARTVVHLGLTYDFSSPLFRASQHAIDLGVAPSPHTAEGWSRRGWPPDALQVIPNGVDTTVFCPGDGREKARARIGVADAARPLVVYVGRLVAEKGIFTLLRAMALYRQRGGAGHLLFAGAAPADETARLSRIAREEKLAEGDWEIRPATAKPEDIYRAADLVVVPSEWDEPFGLVPLEAMACGTLALVSDRGILPDFVAPLGSAAVFAAGAAPALADRLAYWLSDADRRTAAAGRLAAHTQTHYGFASCGNAYLDAFQRLLTR